MSQPPEDVGTERGRLMLGAAGAAIALAGATAASPARAAVALPTRARFGLQQNWAVPKSSNAVYVTPFQGAALFNDGDVTMNKDYTLTVNTTGLYVCSIAFDWADNPNMQVGLRINGICRADAGSPPGQFKAGQLTVVKNKNDRIGQYDVSSSNFAWTSRWSGAWKTGTIGKGSVVSKDVTLSPAGLINVGDVATAAHSGISSAIDAGVAALVVTAKVVAADTVRVTIWNSSQTNSVTIPNGTLNVLAMTAQAMTGDAPMGRSVMVSATETFSQGDLLYGTFKSTQGGDTLLATPNTYLQIERWA